MSTDMSVALFAIDRVARQTDDSNGLPEPRGIDAVYDARLQPL